MNDHMLIHQTADKAAFYLGAPPLQWSDALRCWISADPAVIQAVQRSEDFRVVDHRHETERIKARLGISFPNIHTVFATSPMSHEGQEHAAIRQRMAKFLAPRTSPALQRFAARARDLCQAHLAHAGSCDAITDIFEPLALDLGEGLSGVEIARYADHVTPTQLFDRALGLNRRRTIDRRIGEIVEKARQQLEADDIDVGVALAILGSDTVLGSLALSFVERVTAQAGTPLAGIDWGDRLTVTAVPFIERQAVRAVDVAGNEVREGDLIRLYLDRYALEPATTRDAFFGTGRHTCVGRAVAQQAWRLLSTALGEIDTVAEITHVHHREADCMFLYPVSVGVTTRVL